MWSCSFATDSLDMENQGRNVVVDETFLAGQVVHGATQDQIDDTTALDTILDHGLDGDVSGQEQVVELSPEEAELLAMRFVDLIEETDSQTEDQDGYSDDEYYNARAVADLNHLQFGTQQCYICTDDVCHSNVLQLGCGDHWLCHDCIASPFEQAIQQESCYPPRCCDSTGPLNIGDFAHLLAMSHPDVVVRYDAKLQEYHMDKRFRRYCGSSECKTFLNPERYELDAENDTTTGDCPACNRTTCVSCKKIVCKATSHDCESTVLKSNKDYSAEARFKYCPFCECPGLLDEGCNHVTCECGEEWCFVCLRKWNDGYDHEECGQYNVCLTFFGLGCLTDL